MRHLILITIFAVTSIFVFSCSAPKDNHKKKPIEVSLRDRFLSEDSTLTEEQIESKIESYKDFIRSLVEKKDSNKAEERDTCNSDSLRILLRAYYFDEDSRITREQIECFYPVIKTMLDSALYGFGIGYNRLAMEILDKLLADSTLDSLSIADVYYLKGYDLVERHGFYTTEYLKESDAYFDSALAYNTNYDLAWYNKGLIHLRDSALTDARDCIKKALDIRVNQIHYWFYYGIIQYHHGDKNDAHTSFNKVIQYMANTGKNFLHFGSLLARRKVYDEAIIFLACALAKKPHDPDVWFEYGIAYYLLDSTHNYRQYFDSTLKYATDDGHDIATYGVRCSGHKVQDYMHKFYNRALSIDPYMPIVWYYKSSAYWADKIADSSIMYLDSALKYDTTYIFIHHSTFKGHHLMALDMFEEAMEYLEDVEYKALDSALCEMNLEYRIICYEHLNETMKLKNICDSLQFFLISNTKLTQFCDSVTSR